MNVNESNNKYWQQQEEQSCLKDAGDRVQSVKQSGLELFYSECSLGLLIADESTGHWPLSGDITAS